MDDGLISGSPDKERPQGQANQRAVVPGWRRPNEWGPNGEVKEGAEGWRPGQRMVNSTSATHLQHCTCALLSWGAAGTIRPDVAFEQGLQQVEQHP